MSTYSFFAQYYDALTENAEYQKRADHLMELFRRLRHNPGVTLDLACGTGSLTLELCKRGIDIFGADASSDMLSIAQQKAYEADKQILFLCQKMQKLELYGYIDTCICSLDSINHLTSEDDVIKTFRCIEKYLSPDGLFVFDANTVYKHKHILGDNCFIYDTDTVFCAWQNSFFEENNRVDITLDFFAPDGKKYQRHTEEFSEYAYTQEKMEEMLHKAGLKCVAVYDELSFDEPCETSQRLVYAVRKENYE